MVYFSATEKSDTSSVSIISPRISAGSLLNSMKDGGGVPISVGELLFFHHGVIWFECLEYGGTNPHQKNCNGAIFNTHKAATSVVSYAGCKKIRLFNCFLRMSVSLGLFISYFVAPTPTLSHWLGDILTQQIFIIELVLLRPVVYREPLHKVGSQSLG